MIQKEEEEEENQGKDEDYRISKTHTREIEFARSSWGYNEYIKKSASTPRNAASDQTFILTLNITFF